MAGSNSAPGANPTYPALLGGPWVGFRGFLAFLVAVEKPFLMGT